MMQVSNKEAHVLPTSKLQRDAFTLPSYEALAEILSEYHNLFSLPKAGPQPLGQHETLQPTGQAGPDTQNRTPHSPPAQRRLSVPEIGDGAHTIVKEQETRELETYCKAMQRMASDIIKLRKQVVGLEKENSHLRSDLNLHLDLGHSLLDDTDIDVMTKAEIADRIASLKFKLASETSKAAAQKNKIQQLQNELIRRNDSEKELLNLQQTHQQATLQVYQDQQARIRGLEATVRQQEKVIEKMEKTLESSLKERLKLNKPEQKTQETKGNGKGDDRKNEVESALAADNFRLRAELEKLRGQPLKTSSLELDCEKLTLLSELERVQMRVSTLESQLMENARQWGREKQEMLTRLGETTHGFSPTSPMILNDPPQIVSLVELKMMQEVQRLTDVDQNSLPFVAIFNGLAVLCGFFFI